MYLDKLEHLKKLTSRGLIASAITHRFWSIPDFDDFLDYAEFMVKDIMVRRYNEQRYFDTEHHAINYLFMFIQKNVFKQYFETPKFKGRERNASAFSPKMFAYADDLRIGEGGYGFTPTTEEKLEWCAASISGSYHQQVMPIDELIASTKVLITNSDASEHVKSISTLMLDGKTIPRVRESTKHAATILLKMKIKQASWTQTL